MTPAAACLKRYSCEICLSNYLLDLEPKMPKHFSSILSSFFSNAVSETFSDSFSKLCYALRGTCQKGPSKLLRRWKQAFAAGRAFWRLEPQACLARIPFPAKHAAKPQVHKRISQPHFAASTCCNVLSSHGDDSWIQYEALFLWSMKSQEQTSYHSYLFQMHHISSRTCSSDRPVFVRTEFL